MKRLHVKKVSPKTVNNKWGFHAYRLHHVLYIRCNVKGNINWDKAPVYHAEELVGRDNVKILS